MAERGRSPRGEQRGASDEKFGVSAPSITLPKGGGAISGIEKFAANPVTGTGSMTVPMFTSPGRSGFGPQLSLSYDSGAGNGPLGFGWKLSVPSITPRTDNGVPIYFDTGESDIFILSGTEDLVPVLANHNGRSEHQPFDSPAHRAAPYERNRLIAKRFPQRYVENIHYGNRTPREVGEDLALRDDWSFEVVFDYGEHDEAVATARGLSAWPVMLKRYPMPVEHTALQNGYTQSCEG